MGVDLSKFGKSRGEFKMDNLGQVLADNTDEFIEKMQASLASDNTNASGKLSQSISPSVELFGFKINVVISMEDYWRYVDEGRGAGPVPYNQGNFSVLGFSMSKSYPDIIKWLIQKQVNYMSWFPRPKKGLTLKGKKNAIKGAAFIIARKKKRKATVGTGFYSDSVTEYIKNLTNEMSKALKQDVLVHLRTN